MSIADARSFKKRLIMLSYQDAYKIADSVHKGQQDKAGGPYIDFLQNVADYLKTRANRKMFKYLPFCRIPSHQEQKRLRTT